MAQPIENPFKNFRHTASLASMPVFLFTVILMLASLQPDDWRIFMKSVIVFTIAIITGIGGGWGTIQKQVRKGNEHYDTPLKRKYMGFVYTCSLTGIVGIIWLGIIILKGWLLINLQVLMISMLTGSAVALLVSAILWRLLGWPGNKK